MQLEGRVRHQATPPQQLAHKYSALDLREGAADAGARPVSEREISVSGRGEVRPTDAFEALGIEDRGVGPYRRVSANRIKREVSVTVRHPLI